MSMLNAAEWATGVTSLGPGKRAVVWVQGCPRRCPECIAPEWIPIEPAKLVHAEKLADAIAARDGLHGLTLSGGEPMLQAHGLVALWERIQLARPDWTLIIFSGFTRRQLLREGHPARTSLLSAADAFIGGPYVAALNDGRGLRGSTNQEIHIPANSRFTPAEREALRHGERAIEFQSRSDGVLQIGIPPRMGTKAILNVSAPAYKSQEVFTQVTQ